MWVRKFLDFSSRGAMLSAGLGTPRSCLVRKTSLQYFVSALAGAERLTIKTKRNVRRAVQAVDAGLCRFTRESTGHRVHDVNWKVDFGIELTEDGRKIAAV